MGRAVVVELAGGERAVVHWWPPGRWGPWFPTSFACAEALRARGYPAPETLAHGEALGGYGVVQRWVAGAPVERLAGGVLLQVLDAIELQADATEVHADDHRWVSDVVRRDRAGWWSIARASGSEALRLCEQLEEWVSAAAPPQPRRDYVHLDLNVGNCIADGGQLAGIIDFETMGIGDRTADVAGLLLQMLGDAHRQGEAPDPVDVGHIVAAGRSISGEGGWREAVTYHVLSQLAWRSPEGLHVPLDQALTVGAAAIVR